MLSSIGIIVTLYIFVRYVEIWQKADVGARAALLIVIFITIANMFAFFDSTVAQIK